MNITPPPRYLSYEENNHKSYQKLENDKTSPFYNKDHWQVFTIAAVKGYQRGIRTPIKKRYANIKLNSFPEKQLWVLKAIAITEDNSLDILFDQSKMFKIIEEYANSGFELIKNGVLSSPGKYQKQVEAELRKILE